MVVLSLEILATSLIHSAEIMVYQEWKHKLTSKVFIHLFHGNEVIRTADNSSLIWIGLLVLIEIFLAIVLLHSLFFRHRHFKLPFSIVSTTCFFTIWLIELGMCFLFARGGIQQIPINIDASYYSKNFKLNDIAINSSYFLANSYFLFLNSDIHKFVPKIDSNEARKQVDSLYQKNSSTTDFFLTKASPNIVLVILEGWSSSALESLEEFEGYDTKFAELKSGGVYFNNIYATNTTSEIGHTSILGGFPSLSEVSISNYPEKHRNIPTINQMLNDNGYTSHYIFGGDTKYGNIESFLVDHGFDDIVDEDLFPSGLSHGKLSYHDEDVYSYFMELHKHKSTPFFSVIFTGSTHSPYDYPKNNFPKWQGKEKSYMNSLIYAENALFHFIENARNESWYPNTLFVFVSDHSHSSPKFEIPYEAGFFKIPLLFFGEVIQELKKGTKISTIGSQADLPATLLHQLNISSKKFPFSKNLGDSLAHSFSMLATIRGYGYVNPFGSFTYHFDSKKFINKTFNENYFSKAKKESDALFRSYYDYYEGLDTKKE